MKRLSNRELQVLRLVALGKSLKEIAAELALSEKTIGTYRTRISQKLGLGTNVELARYAERHQARGLAFRCPVLPPVSGKCLTGRPRFSSR